MIYDRASNFINKLRACEIPQSVSKTVSNFFQDGLYLDRKKAARTAETMSVLYVAIFWFVNATSCKKSCLQFSIPTWSGLGRGRGGGGVLHRLKTM